MVIKIAGVLLAAFICIFCELPLCQAADYRDTEEPSVQEGMDTIKKGDVNILVPKGGQLRKESSFLVKEDADAYASRKYIETTSHLKELQREIEDQKMEIKKMAEIIEEIRKEKENAHAN